MKKYIGTSLLRPTFLGTFLSVCFLLVLHAAFGQNHARVKGRIVLVDNKNNILKIKLQVQAIDDTNPGKSLKIGTGSLWVRYNDSIVAMAEQPIPATNVNLTDGDYFYPMLSSANYTQKIVQRQSKPDDIKMTSMFSISHFVFETAASAPPVAEPINTWTDIAIFKYEIKKSGFVQLKWNVLAMQEEIKDEADSSYSVNKIDFEDWSGYVTYHQPTLKLKAKGTGTPTDPYLATIISTDNTQREAGTAGFRLYYSSDEVDAVSFNDQLSQSPFLWNNATIVDESIPGIWKNGDLYDRRITYTSHDNNQANDYWPAASTVNPVDLLQLVFTPAAGISGGVLTYLEVIGQESFKTWDRTTDHVVTSGGSESSPSEPNVPLPVTLLDFSGTLQKNNSVLLKWSTASETNNEKFEVERSADGKNFEQIATVKGNGNSNTRLSYEAVDAKALAGISYYRLKQVDFNGEASYSRTIRITNQPNTEGLTVQNLYPNPTTAKATLEFTLATEENLYLTVCDALGKVVLTQTSEGKTGQNKLEIKKLENLPKGFYLISLSTNSQLVTRKLVKE